MKVIPIGTKIVTISGGLKGFITGICIRGIDGGNTLYEIGYFQNGLHSSVWIYSFEFEVDVSQKAGFKAEKSLLLTE